MDHERLSALDTAFLRLESPQAPMHLGALAIFQPREKIPPARLAAVLGERVRRIPALRQRARTTWWPPGGAVWTPDTTFDPSQHIRVHQLKRAKNAMTVLASELMAEPLDLSRPLWQIHLMTGLPEGRFALLIKLHHAMADGLRAVELGLRLFDGFTDHQPNHPQPDSTTAMAPPTPTAVQAAAERATRAAHAIADVARSAKRIPRTLSLAASSAGIAASLLSNVRLAVLLPSTLGSSLHDTMHAIARTAAAPKTPPRTARSLALLRLNTHDVRHVRKHYGGTEHDVLLAVITGALRRWLVANNQRPENLNIRALIPVSRRGRTTQPQRHNVLSGYLCDLPIQQDDPITMLHHVRAAMDRHKAAGFARGPGAFPVLTEQIPVPAQHLTIPLLRRAGPLLFDTIITNVPVPSRPITLAGAPLHHAYPIAPLAHGQALGIALSTYRESVHIGLHADHRAVPDLNRLANAIPTALTALAHAISPAP
ncbi:wax ester/triacylglycerol synthase family O-acyltransferase [Dactylosporangium sucinum]|uniref:Diacylglycerol O-acyltransferase n=1 Tax=Dactylosporangium sucinum TaxID=1424081 RepID=A0A917X5F0_9ACTN|nr:wax ester/triacylglycerol synthase family O-acyltransferase [Dactylosporangium sucinum]GGM69274.1 diacylglycerol O-acyltransferase [Dactylosporangium sucinum]